LHPVNAALPTERNLFPLSPFTFSGSSPSVQIRIRNSVNHINK